MMKKLLKAFALILCICISIPIFSPAQKRLNLHLLVQRISE